MKEKLAYTSKTIPILCGSIASVPSELGAIMHNAAYKAAGVPFSFVGFGVEDTKSAVDAIRSLGIRGMGVSLPHKVAIMQYLDKVDRIAFEIGAVNTVVNDSGYLTGYNTDWIGAKHALEEQINLKNKKAIVVGAGGAARAIVYALKNGGSEVVIYNRTETNGKKTAKDLSVDFGGDFTRLSSIEDYDIIINATSVGLNEPNKSSIPSSVLKPEKVVLDVVIIPPNTKLLKEARSKRCIAISGTRMLIYQAVRQFELYTGKKAPIEAMEQAVSSYLG